MYKKLRFLLNYFTKGELCLWFGSMLLLSISFMMYDRENVLTLVASLIGVTALIFNAKGNPLGQALIIVFGGLYGYISFACAYYGEMITYLGMTAPMAVFALISWLRHPHQGNKAEVQINHLKNYEFIVIGILAIVVTILFYHILKLCHTANLVTSTLSITTSFTAMCLTFRRSAYFALAYALNDLVLIVLWLLALQTDNSYLSVVMCFAIFLINDVYTYINWTRIQKRQIREEKNQCLEKCVEKNNF